MHINIDDISVFSQQWKMKLSSLACFKGLLMDCKHFGFFLNLLQVCSTSDDWGSALYLSLCLVYVYLCHHFGLIFILSIQSVKAMATHSSTLAWKIPWTEEPSRLQSMGLLRVGHNWVTSLSLFTFMHWGRKWQPTPVFLPGGSQGRGSLVGCRL